MNFYIFSLIVNKSLLFVKFFTIKEYVWDKRGGSEWFSQVDKNGTPDPKKPIVEPWKCPYHNGRMCLEVMKRAAGIEV